MTVDGSSYDLEVHMLEEIRWLKEHARKQDEVIDELKNKERHQEDEEAAMVPMPLKLSCNKLLLNHYIFVIIKTISYRLIMVILQEHVSNSKRKVFACLLRKVSFLPFFLVFNIFLKFVESSMCSAKSWRQVW
jgi:hypothetical protein